MQIMYEKLIAATLKRKKKQLSVIKLKLSPYSVKVLWLIYFRSNSLNVESEHCFTFYIFQVLYDILLQTVPLIHASFTFYGIFFIKLRNFMKVSHFTRNFCVI